MYGLFCCVGFGQFGLVCVGLMCVVCELELVVFWCGTVWRCVVLCCVVFVVVFGVACCDLMWLGLLAVRVVSLRWCDCVCWCVVVPRL